MTPVTGDLAGLFASHDDDTGLVCNQGNDLDGPCCLSISCLGFVAWE